MAIQRDSQRNTLGALLNGGKVGWGEVINGGLVLDGSDDASRRTKMMFYGQLNIQITLMGCQQWCRKNILVQKLECIIQYKKVDRNRTTINSYNFLCYGCS
ncbi:unnamed protein product [Paramecium sonneborni]|uniref:Urocanase C-terminal domain-containing protein n=1 Tax=Paramecium sonneborni TaxID=65129 RepID=A0A8S1M2N7_9CILI|nr:unnamed protein product [Paramecium sonneborni]